MSGVQPGPRNIPPASPLGAEVLLNHRNKSTPTGCKVAHHALVRMQRIPGCHHSDLRRYLDTRIFSDTVRRLSPSILIGMRLSMNHENPFAGQQGTAAQTVTRVTSLASYNCTRKRPMQARKVRLQPILGNSGQTPPTEPRLLEFETERSIRELTDATQAPQAPITPLAPEPAIGCPPISRRPAQTKEPHEAS
jgi:hypothetical protein